MVVDGGFNSESWDEISSLMDLTGSPLRQYRYAPSETQLKHWSLYRDYVWRGNTLLAAIRNPGVNEQTIYLHPDHLGSPRILTDAAGDTIEPHVYFPFGQEAYVNPGDGDVLQFTGQERDDYAAGDTVDLDYLHARYFSAHLGRFTSVDPSKQGWDPKEPQSWNRYAYSLGNPIKFIDPDGEETQLVVGSQTENNVFGHVALAINGTVYSFGTAYVGKSGDWGVSLGGYLGAQDSKRSTTVMTLDLSPEEENKLRATLEGNDPRKKPYSVLDNPCVTVCEQALESVGGLPNDPGPMHTDSAGNQLQAGAPKSFTPGGLADQVQEAGLVKSSSTQGQTKVSKVKSFFNTIVEAFRRLRE